MKKLKQQLKTIAKSLATLSKQVEKITKQVDKLQPAKKAPAKKKKAAAPKKRIPAKKVVAKKKAAAKKKAPAKKATVLDSVYDVIKKTRKGATIAALKAKTGLNPRQLSNALYKLSTRGLIVSKSRGVYVKK